MSRIFDIAMYTVMAAMLVLVVMNAGNVAKLISTTGDEWVKQLTVLTGTGYKMPAA